MHASAAPTITVRVRNVPVNIRVYLFVILLPVVCVMLFDTNDQLSSTIRFVPTTKTTSRQQWWCVNGSPYDTTTTTRLGVPRMNTIRYRFRHINNKNNNGDDDDESLEHTSTKTRQGRNSRSLYTTTTTSTATISNSITHHRNRRFPYNGNNIDRSDLYRAVRRRLQPQPMITTPVPSKSNPNAKTNAVVVVSSSSSSSSKLVNQQQQQPSGKIELTKLGTILASTVEIMTSTVLNYGTGYITGYIIGTIIGIPQSIFQRNQRTTTTTMTNAVVNQWQQQQQSSSWIRQIHTKSHLQYGRKWGTISSIFAGSRTLVTVLRRRPLPTTPGTQTTTTTILSKQKQNKKNTDHLNLMSRTMTQQQQEQHEQWNDILSSLLAGAVMARNDGPQAMVRNALLFGGMSYLFSSSATTGTTTTKGNKQMSSYDEPYSE